MYSIKCRLLFVVNVCDISILVVCFTWHDIMICRGFSAFSLINLIFLIDIVILSSHFIRLRHYILLDVFSLVQLIWLHLLRIKKLIVDVSHTDFCKLVLLNFLIFYLHMWRKRNVFEFKDVSQANTLLTCLFCPVVLFYKLIEYKVA